MPLPPPPDLKLWLPACPESVTAARRAAVGYARALGLVETAVDDLALAVTEACANAVVHAYDESEPGCFELTAGTDRNALVVTVRDWGRGMVARSDSPGLGLGLMLMTQLSAALDTRAPADGGAEIRMTMPLGSADRRASREASRSAACRHHTARRASSAMSSRGSPP
jgi:anti-sigma regulatory factor (Ser/Thr protein kinase)